jgi:hypothetical protein
LEKRPSICDRTLIDLSWDGDQLSREFICQSVLAVSRDLDYALIRIRAIEGSAAIGPIPLNLHTDDVTASMIHHPAASQKVISAGCAIVDQAIPSWFEGTLTVGFSHTCDPERGSSGAPMFNTKGEMIGLHHLGFEMDAAKGQCDQKNKATWLSAILGDLKEKVASGHRNIEAFDLQAIEDSIVP